MSLGNQGDPEWVCARAVCEKKLDPRPVVVLHHASETARSWDDSADPAEHHGRTGGQPALAKEELMKPCERTELRMVKTSTRVLAAALLGVGLLPVPGAAQQRHEFRTVKACRGAP